MWKGTIVAATGNQGDSGDQRERRADATDLVRARSQLLAAADPAAVPGRRLSAPALRQALGDLFELWLTGTGAAAGVLPESGFALVAVGGLGRGEMLPYSDLDLLLLHADHEPERVAAVADRLWYPLWDAHVKLDHSVRTPAQARAVAAGDLTAGLGLLEARHITGDPELSSQLIAAVRQDWRAGIRNRFDELVEQARTRWERSGEIAHRAEPDLKSGRGGLRDGQLLDALALAQLTDPIPALPGRAGDASAGSVKHAYQRLLDVRTELHRVAGRGRDQLLAQDADEIGAALGIGDRFELARTLSDCARTVSFAVESGLRTAANALPRRGLSRLRRLPVRRPLDEGVVEHGGEVVLAREAYPERDPGLVLRVAAAAAQSGMPIAATTLARLAEAAPELREPWPKDALNDLLVLLGSGASAVSVIEALDRSGLWGRLLPEWGAVRDLPPRDSVHTWTVDRHLVETTVYASGFVTRVARPDLLLLGALLHDIGKGRAGDHSAVGADIAGNIAQRLGLWPSDVQTLCTLVRHHLLLPGAATRRDIADPATVRMVAAALGSDPQLLELLHALAEADSLATGPGVWSDWKAALIGDLVRRCRVVLAGDALPSADPIDPALLTLARSGGVHVDIAKGTTPHTYAVTVIAPDRTGLLADSAGVLALHTLRVLSASVGGHAGSAINTFTVAPRFGAPPAPGLLRQELMRAMAGELDLVTALAKKETEAAQSAPLRGARAGVPTTFVKAPPRIIWTGLAATGETLLEVRAEDRLGLLSRLAAAVESAGADVRWAKVATRGAVAVDVFCLRMPSGARPELERAVLAAVSPDAPLGGAG